MCRQLGEKYSEQRELLTPFAEALLGWEWALGTVYGAW